MNIDLMVEKGKEIVNNSIEEVQKFFTNESVINAIDTGVDIGIRTFIPDIVEDHIIDIKNTIVNEGIEKGLDEVNEKINDFKTNVLGIFNGEFKDINQMKMITEDKGVLDGISGIINEGVNIAKSAGFINKATAKDIVKVKNSIMKNTKATLKETFEKEIDKIEKLEKYNEKWKKALDDRDFDKMQKYIDKIEKLEKDVVKFRELSEEISKNKELHNWMKENNTYDFMVGLDGALVKLN